MSETCSPSSQPDNKNNEDNVVADNVPSSSSIPVEIISDGEMAIIESALALAASRSSTIRSSQLQRNVRSLESITMLSKRSFAGRARSEAEIEDLGNMKMTEKRSRIRDSLLHRFRRKRGLSVTDVTATEWCERQMEFFLLLSRRKTTKAMKAGSARHAILEEEVIKRVKVHVESAEDKWALKFLNFLAGVNQLLSEGLTRELPITGFVEGVWMVGVIDELRLPKAETDRNPVLVDTKTRVRDTLPAEPQRRNGRLQLMCYKYIWDDIVADKFPSEKFYTFFSLNPYRTLSEGVREYKTTSGFPIKTLDDVLRYYRNTCSTLHAASSQLLLRYELQKDNSVIAEDQFAYDSDWLKGQLKNCLEFWLGEREASYTPEDERWKCRYCQFASICPGNTRDDVVSSPRRASQDSPSSSSTDPESTLS